MKESPPPVSRNIAGPTRKSSWRKSYPVDDGGDLIECSGKYCRSCTAVLIADCVALCCCPCAVLNILAFAFVKIPYMVGRRCLRLGKKKKKTKGKCKKVEGGTGGFVVERVVAADHGKGNNLNLNNKDNKKERVLSEEGVLEIVSSEFCEEEQMQMSDGSDGARFDAEEIWLELYQIGHLGFGRVSYTDIQSLDKGT